MIDRSLIRNIDWTLLSLLLLNSVIGIVFIYSSSHYVPEKYYLRQIIWLILSMAALSLFLFIDYEVLVTYSFYFYLLLAAVLVGILLLGKLVAGARSWIVLPFFNVQPSEMMKIAVILLLAQVFSEFRNEYLSLKKGLISGAVVAFPYRLSA